jgi:hypothetical protein
LNKEGGRWKKQPILHFNARKHRQKKLFVVVVHTYLQSGCWQKHKRKRIYLFVREEISMEQSNIFHLPIPLGQDEFGLEQCDQKVWKKLQKFQKITQY